MTAAAHGNIAVPRAARASLDIEALRALFPALHQQVHGKPLVYLDNAATTHKPRRVIEAVRHFYEADNSNVHRGVHLLSQRATEGYEGARTKLRTLLGAASDREVIWTRGTTEGINLVAQCFARPRLGPGDEIVVTEMEHHSNIVPWQIVCEQTGATLKVLPVTDSGELRLDLLDELLTERTLLLGVVHASNALGTINPIADIVKRAHAKGVAVLVDGAQAVAHMPIDVQALDVDFFATSGHKMYGPTGIGVLYGKEALLDAMPPWQGGGDMIERVSLVDGTTWNVLPHKFEAGTPNIAGAIGMGEAADFLRELDWKAVQAHEADVLAYGTELLSEIPGLRLVGTAPHKVGVLSFVMDGLHPQDVGTILDMTGVAIRTGHHCTQPLMERYGIPATARASPALYTTRAELDALVVGLRKCKDMLG